MQKLLDMVSEGQMYKRVATGANMSLGALIAELGRCHEDMVVNLPDGTYPGEVGSYRGYYSDLAIKPSSEPVTVGVFLPRLKEALGETFTGYKGGDYRMEAHTPVWVAPYSECGPPVKGLIRTGFNEMTIVLGEQD